MGIRDSRHTDRIGWAVPAKHAGSPRKSGQYLPDPPRTSVTCEEPTMGQPSLKRAVPTNPTERDRSGWAAPAKPTVLPGWTAPARPNTFPGGQHLPHPVELVGVLRCCVGQTAWS